MAQGLRIAVGVLGVLIFGYAALVLAWDQVIASRVGTREQWRGLGCLALLFHAALIVLGFVLMAVGGLTESNDAPRPAEPRTHGSASASHGKP